MKVAVVGYGENKIAGKEKDISNWFKEIFRDFKKQGENIILLNRATKGVNQIAAFVAISEEIPFNLYFAYRHEMSVEESYFIVRAQEVKFMKDKYQVGCISERDRRMVDDCDVLMVVWDRKKYGGVYYTYEYALEEGKKIIMFDWNIKRNF